MPRERFLEKMSNSRCQEVIRGDAGLLQNRPECSFGHVAWVVGHRCVSIRSGVEPDLMASSGLTIEFESERLQLPSDLAVSESC
jgi:hypothetical protein